MRLDDAVTLAARAHAGQVDLAGKPYVAHPLRVMQRVSWAPEAFRMAAVLHDVVEDTGVTLADLVAAGCPADVVAAVDALTRRGAGPTREPYLDFVARCRGNLVAAVVKQADLLDNLDPDRLAALPLATRVRLVAKYTGALEVLEGRRP